MKTSTNYRSLSRICGDLRVPFHRLEKVIAEHGITPSLTLNGTRHFDDQAVEKIYRALRAKRTRRGDALCAHHGAIC
jgi:hypothetical protein